MDIVAQIRDELTAILDSPIDPSSPRCLDEIQRVRSATRRIVEADLRDSEKAVLIVELAEASRDCDLPDWAKRAIAEEYLQSDACPPLPLSLRVAQRRMRRAGYVRCPACAHPILPESVLERHDRLHQEADRQAASSPGTVAP